MISRWQRDEITDGLVIDDYFVLSKEFNDGRPPEDSQSVQIFEKAKKIYAREGILGSDEKDVKGELQFKVCGAEIDSSLESVARGVVSAGIPLDKRMNLAMLSASIATLPYTSDALHASLVGSWISALMMRRPLFSIMNEIFKVVPPEELCMEKPVLRPLSRVAAQELLLLACLAPVAVSNLSAEFLPEIFATDASMEKGGVVGADCPVEVVKALWRSADRKGCSVPIPCWRSMTRCLRSCLLRVVFSLMVSRLLQRLRGQLDFALSSSKFVVEVEL